MELGAVVAQGDRGEARVPELKYVNWALWWYCLPLSELYPIFLQWGDHRINISDKATNLTQKKGPSFQRGIVSSQGLSSRYSAQVLQLQLGPLLHHGPQLHHRFWPPASPHWIWNPLSDAENRGPRDLLFVKKVMQRCRCVLVKIMIYIDVI